MEIRKEDIGNRLKEVRKRLKMTQAELGDLLGVGNKAVSAYETGAADLSTVALAKLAVVANVSIDWIITGEGHLPTAEASKGVTKIGKQTFPPEGCLPDGYTRANVYLLGGAGAPHELAENEPVDSLILPAKYLRPNIVPIKIRGHSMEPIIFDGAYVGVDRTERRLISGEIYAVSLPYEGTVVKRIYMAADKVILKSDNRDFPELSISIDKIDPDNFIFGRVKWVLQEF